MRHALAAISIMLASALALAQTAPPTSEELKKALEQMGKEIEDANEWQELVCFPSKCFVCNGEVCEPATPKVHLRLTRDLTLDRERGTMSRCDNSCDTHNVHINTAGIFTSIQPLNSSGAFVKVRGAQDYIEVVSLGLTVYFSTGGCTHMR